MVFLLSTMVSKSYSRQESCAVHLNPLPMKPLLHTQFAVSSDGVQVAYESQGLGLHGSVEKIIL